MILTPNGPRPGPMSGELRVEYLSHRRANYAHGQSMMTWFEIYLSILHNDIIQTSLIIVMLREYM